MSSRRINVFKLNKVKSDNIDMYFLYNNGLTFKIVKVRVSYYIILFSFASYVAKFLL